MAPPPTQSRKPGTSGAPTAAATPALPANAVSKPAAQRVALSNTTTAPPPTRATVRAARKNHVDIVSGYRSAGFLVTGRGS